MRKKGVLILNLGTPNSPSVKDVRVYLREFLNDPRVIDIGRIAQLLLVNLIIVPFRAPKSAKEYKKLFKIGHGKSPLLTYGKSLRKKLNVLSNNEYDVELAMRYGSPSMDNVLSEMRLKNYDEIYILPLYPQYASASSGSTIEKAFKIINKWWTIPEVNIIGPTNLLPKDLGKFGVNIYTDMKKGVKDCDIVMMLRLQNERMTSSYLSSNREYYEYYGLTPEKLEFAKTDALIMHPGPMNRGIEIDTMLADDINKSVIKEQVELGVAVRMACLKIFCS